MSVELQCGSARSARSRPHEPWIVKCREVKRRLSPEDFFKEHPKLILPCDLRVETQLRAAPAMVSNISLSHNLTSTNRVHRAPIGSLISRNNYSLEKEIKKRAIASVACKIAAWLSRPEEQRFISHGFFSMALSTPRICHMLSSFHPNVKITRYLNH